MSESPKQPREITIPGAHAQILPLVTKHVPPSRDVRVLDLGAGQGAMSLRLLEQGYDVSACDLFPHVFCCPGIECRKVDLSGDLGYDDASFDLVLCIEVVEHLESQLGLFQEVSRILAPGGVFMFTTPNISSFKSRLSFLFSGYFYAHGPLDVNVDCPVTQHVAAFTPNRYRFVLDRAGLDMTTVEVDKRQRSSRAFFWMAPLVRWYAKFKHGKVEGIETANSSAALFGRSLVVVAEKKEASAGQQSKAA